MELESNIFARLSTGDECPETHPYAYHKGDYCCQINEEDYAIAKYEAGCDGSTIDINVSMCCKGHQYTSCPGLKQGRVCSNSKKIEGNSKYKF